MAESSDGITVVDVETTGLNPWKHHRVIEIGIVRLDSNGETIDEFESLVNPERDIGAQDIHGLSAKELRHAPRFADLAGHIIGRLGSGRIVAGHNVHFDAGFIECELERAGYAAPGLKTLCTMRLFGGSLAACCDEEGIPHGQAHAAIDDARATAELVRIAIKRGYELHGAIYQRKGPGTCWPTAVSAAAPLRRCDVTQVIASQPHFLSRLVTRLHEGTLGSSDAREVRDYQGLLSRVLEDRLVSEEEGDALFQFASDYGLNADQVVRAHVHYLKQLATAAVADGELTDSERADLQAVARLLGCDQDVLDRALVDAWEFYRTGEIVVPPVDDLRGKTVCFTGELLTTIDGEVISRETAHALAEDHGLIVKDSVTKKLDLLVVADPHSMSGKAKKARSYGIRVMADAVFWKTIGVATD